MSNIQKFLDHQAETNTQAAINALEALTDQCTRTLALLKETRETNPEDLRGEFLWYGDHSQGFSYAASKVERKMMVAASSMYAAVIGREHAPKPINLLFDGPPGPECGHFVEVEDDDGAGIKVGEWIERHPYWVLRITEMPS